MDGWRMNALVKNPCISTLSYESSILNLSLAMPLVNFLWLVLIEPGGWVETLAIELACALCHAVAFRAPSDCIHPLPVLQWEAVLMLAVKLEKGSCGRDFYETKKRVKMGPDKQSRQQGEARSTSTCAWTNKVIRPGGAWDSGGSKHSVWIGSSVTVRGRCQEQRMEGTLQRHWIYSSLSKEAWLGIKKKIIFFNASFP